jgi:hypothetical protein
MLASVAVARALLDHRAHAVAPERARLMPNGAPASPNVYFEVSPFSLVCSNRELSSSGYLQSVSVKTTAGMRHFSTVQLSNNRPAWSRINFCSGSYSLSWGA